MLLFVVPQSLANLLTHLIFSTKNRETLLIGKNLQQRTHAYLAAILKDMDCPALVVGGVADHVHILCRLAKNTIGLQCRGAYKGVFLKMAEDTRKPYFRLATRLWRFFGQPIARRASNLLHREARAAPSNDDV